jgi:hypothetical protein
VSLTGRIGKTCGTKNFFSAMMSPILSAPTGSVGKPIKPPRYSSLDAAVWQTIYRDARTKA